MASLVDSADESELLPPTRTDVDTWMATYIRVMGSLPFETEEPRANQSAALFKKAVTNKQVPCVDFGVWTPFEMRMSKHHKCRVFLPLGSFLQNDIPGPSSFQAWTGIQSSCHLFGHSHSCFDGCILQPCREVGAAVAGMLGLSTSSGGHRASREGREAAKAVPA